VGKQKAVVRAVRFDEDISVQMDEATKARGFASPSAFIRTAVERELKHQESNLDETELRVTASLDRVARELRGVRLGHQALFAFVDSLAKTLLTCVPEPPPDGYNQAVARGKARYDRFLKSVGMGMAGESRAALTELVRRVQEE
jgi:hypothetical protein